MKMLPRQYAASLVGGVAGGAVKSELVVCARDTQPVLAWDVQIAGECFDRTPSEAHFIPDAGSMQLLDRWDAIHTAASAGTGKSLLSGAVSLTTDSQTSNYALRDPSRGSHALRQQHEERHQRQRHPVHRHRQRVGHRGHLRHRHRGGGCPVRPEQDLRLQQDQARPQRHCQRRPRRLQPGALQLGLRQCLLERQLLLHDLRRRRRLDLPAAGGRGRGGPRNDPWRDGQQRQADPFRRIRRPERSHLRHLRHDGGVLCRQLGATRSACCWGPGCA